MTKVVKRQFSVGKPVGDLAKRMSLFKSVAANSDIACVRKIIYAGIALPRAEPSAIRVADSRLLKLMISD